MKYEYWLACLKGISPNEKNTAQEARENSRRTLLYRRNTDGGI